MIVAGIIGCICLFTIVPRAVSIYELSSRKKELLEEKARLTQINAEQQQLLEEVDSPAGMERIAREQLGMVKNGETSIIRVLPAK
jgi:cell division protein FtsB